MKIQIQDTNLGLSLITIEEASRISPPSPRRITQRSQRQSRTFTRRAQRRLKLAASILRLDPETSFFVTLPFQPGIAPKDASKLRGKLLRWLRDHYRGCGGIYSLEFKDITQVHYHMILLFGNLSPAAALTAVDALKVKWEQISGTSKKVDAGLIRSAEAAVRYLSKWDHQRIVPACFENDRTRFWDTFGVLPKLEAVTLHCSDELQQLVREIAATKVEGQDSARAFPYAQSLRASSGKIDVYLLPELGKEFISEVQQAENCPLAP